MTAPLLHVADLSTADGALSTWVLIGQPPDEDDGWNYRTAAVRVIHSSAGDDGAVTALVDDSYGAWLVKKAIPGQAFANTVLVGRATTNDICLQHTSVSKLHARLRLAGDEIFVSDAGSSNGTAINGIVLRDGEELPLRNGDLVRFGSVALQAFEPLHLTDILRKLRR